MRTRSAAPRRSSSSKVSPILAVARSTAAPPSSRASVEDLAPAAQLREGDAGVALLVADPLDGGELGLEADQVVGREPLEDRVARLSLDAVLGEQLAVEVGVAEPDHGPVQPGRGQRRLQHLDHLGGALRGRGADQLDAGLGELAHLAALGAHRAVGAGQVAEPHRHLGVGEAGGGEAGDRHGHFGAQGEQVAALVEEAVARAGRAPVAAGEHLVVLDRRRRDLAVAARLEDPEQRGLEPAQLAHLVGQDVSCPRGDRMNHRPPDLTRVRRKPCYAGISAETRSIRAPSERRRSSICS